MGPTIHCVRHAQGFHNLGGGDYTLPDPSLTPLGKQQCESLRAALFPKQANISLIMASPLCRTLNTASLVFGDALASSEKDAGKILAVPDAQEISDDLCDTGSDPDVLQYIAVENAWPVDLSLVQDGWNDKSPGGRFSPRDKAVRARAHSVRLLLRQKIRELLAMGIKSPEVVLVTHGGFLHYLTDDWEDSDTYAGTGWRNCETRSYRFEEDPAAGVNAEARLVETTESRLRRGKESPVLGREKQLELFKVACSGGKVKDCNVLIKCSRKAMDVGSASEEVVLLRVRLYMKSEVGSIYQVAHAFVDSDTRMSPGGGEGYGAFQKGNDPAEMKSFRS
jgi:broad specificity phosphatase PhoE